MDEVKRKLFQKIKVDTETQCWKWQLYKDYRGYGQLKHNGRTQFAHRVFFKVFKGPIPEGLVVMHTCDNPSCVNPEHLKLGSTEQNMIDMSRKGRQGNQILTLNDVFAIKNFLRRRKLSAKGNMEYGACTFLAEWFGVKRTAISSIISGKCWTHIN